MIMNTKMLYEAHGSDLREIPNFSQCIKWKKKLGTKKKTFTPATSVNFINRGSVFLLLLLFEISSSEREWSRVLINRRMQILKKNRSQVVVLFCICN